MMAIRIGYRCAAPSQQSTPPWALAPSFSLLCCA